MKPKLCRQCKTKFQPVRILQSVCSPNCAIELANKKRIALERTETRLERSETKKRLDAIKPLRKLASEAQTAFNAYIRERDKHLPCISCQRHHQGQYHAGHYRTTAAAPQLRYTEDGCHKQCSACNTHLSGNITAYRINLINKIGISRVESLENNNTIRKYTREELVEIKKTYKSKLQEIL